MPIKEIDMRCDCRECTERTEETYELPAACGNCNDVFIAILRKGDTVGSKECPTCGWDRYLHWRAGTAQGARDMRAAARDKDKALRIRVAELEEKVQKE